MPSEGGECGGPIIASLLASVEVFTLPTRKMRLAWGFRAERDQYLQRRAWLVLCDVVIWDLGISEQLCLNVLYTAQLHSLLDLDPPVMTLL